MLTIYALKLENNKYYIGKTQRGVGADIRFEEHKTGKGSEWTRLHKPISVMETYEHDSAFEEDVFTKKYMMKYGIENVRGGSYVKIILDDWQIKSLEHEFKSVNDTCFKCGKKGHFAENCEKYNMDEYLSLFKTEEELDTEIVKLTELRKHLRIKQNQIENLKYINYTLNNNINKVITIEPKILDEFGFWHYKFQNGNNGNDVRVLIYTKILQRLNARNGCNILQEDILQENVVENIYKIYIERIKLEKGFKNCLDENKLSLSNYTEEINTRIEYLYEKYSKIISISM